MGSTIDRLRHVKIEKRTRWLAWVESLLILGLLVWISHEYESNLYLQSWLAGYVGPLGFLLNGTLAGVYAGGLAGYTMSLYISKKTEEEKILETIKKKTS